MKPQCPMCKIELNRGEEGELWCDRCGLFLPAGKQTMVETIAEMRAAKIRRESEDTA